MEVSSRINSLVGDVGKVSLNIKGEGSELSNVNTLTCTEVVVKIGNKGSPNDHHLN